MNRRRALTLAEVLVAGFVFLMIMLVAESIMNYVQRIGLKARAQLEPRQQIRSALTHAGKDLRGGAYIYEGFTGSILGSAVSVPRAGETGEALVFAVPEPLGGGLSYRVCALFARPRSQPDPNNPGARELVYHQFPSQATIPADTPGALNPGTLTGGSTRVFDAYVPTGAFTVRLTPNGQAAALTVSFAVKPLRGPTVSERFETLLTMRNNV